MHNYYWPLQPTTLVAAPALQVHLRVHAHNRHSHTPAFQELCLRPRHANCVTDPISKCPPSVPALATFGWCGSQLPRLTSAQTDTPNAPLLLISDRTRNSHDTVSHPQH